MEANGGDGYLDVDDHEEPMSSVYGTSVSSKDIWMHNVNQNVWKAAVLFMLFHSLTLADVNALTYEGVSRYATSTFTI